MDRLLVGKSIELQLVDQAVSGERGVLEVLCSSFNSFCVPIRLTAIGPIYRLLMGVPLILQLVCLLYTSDAADEL